MQFIDTFAKHKAEPRKSLDSYLKERRLALGKELKDRKKIYLDTKYWILLRDCKLGRSDQPILGRLLDMLQRGVTAQKLLCPISTDVFIEILKQTNEVNLRCTVKLVDTLSLGVSVLYRQERTRMELLYFLFKILRGEEKCLPPDVFVWTKLAYTLGFTTPRNTGFSPEDELLIQKVFLDQMWHLSLSDLVENMGIDVIRKMPRMSDISTELNKGKFSHTHENRSFKQMFLSELAGALDTMLPDLSEIFEYMYENFTGAITPREKVEPNLFRNIIYHGFRLNRFTTELPSIRIRATLHAAIRWDAMRKYKATDIHDINHAEAALPYFKVFLTERSLRDLVTRKSLNLHGIYNCQVLVDPAEALEAIERIVVK
jgi:hypothetical protein